jgi:hypothetical protein
MFPCIFNDFVNLENLPTQFSKMLVEIGFACTYVYRGECAYIICIYIVLYCVIRKNAKATSIKILH